MNGINTYESVAIHFSIALSSSAMSTSNETNKQGDNQIHERPCFVDAPDVLSSRIELLLLPNVLCILLFLTFIICISFSAEETSKIGC
jgi:hypothetical protein